MLKDVTISAKLALGFAITALAAIIMAWSGRHALIVSQAQLDLVGNSRVPTLYALGQMSSGALHVASGVRGLVNRRMMDPQTRQSNYEEVRVGIAQVNNGRKLYEPFQHDADSLRVWSQVLPLWDQWMVTVQAVIALQEQKDSLLAQGLKTDDPRVEQLDAQAFEATSKARAQRKQCIALIEELISINDTLAKADVAEGQRVAAQSMSTMYVLIGIMLVVCVGAGVLVSRSVKGTLSSLIQEAHRLTRAATAGQLSTRGDLEIVPKEFQGLVRGINEILDAVIGPLTVAADYVDRISQGNIPPVITENYQGDFNAIKQNLNKCIAAINGLVADTVSLSQAAVEGRLSFRASTENHIGEYRKIVSGFNSTLDAVIQPVMEATGVLEGLSHYDLRVRMEGDYQGDHARIKTALNATAEALHDALGQVAEAVNQLSEASVQIAASSQSVAQGASEQASSLEETSSSLEEMASMTKQNADNTIQARSLAKTTKEAAERGGQSMGKMTEAMEKIRAASEGTAQIIKDINEIAFQTNLLALNAAVEAARAGDAGRGFAVVAEEVRNLALRSKEAAKKTEDLIKMAVNHTENGRVITQEVASSLTDIVNAAGKVNDIVSEIAVASQEQSRGIEQVNNAVAEMDKVVQVAAANAEESSSAAEELSSQSQELAGLVSRFELGRDGMRSSSRDGAATMARRRPPVAASSVTPPRRGNPSKGKVSSRSNTSSSHGNGHSPAVKADDLIPMGPDPDFQDF